MSPFSPPFSPPASVRPARLCRTWMFLEGANESVLASAPACGADVLIQELEDFTPPALRPKAREMAPRIYAGWRAAGAVVAVRVNPLADGGLEDLEAVMAGRPDIVALPKVAEPRQVAELDAHVTRLEQAYGYPSGSTALLPNIEFARGLVQLGAIAAASPRVTACLLAAEDLAADLGAEREPDSLELAYARQRFLVECVAAGVVAVDCPYTWADQEGADRDARWARRLGYRAKSAVDSTHAPVITAVFTPAPADVAAAERLVRAFEAARETGAARVELDGALVEVPGYLTAKRRLARAAELAAWSPGGV